MRELPRAAGSLSCRLASAISRSAIGKRKPVEIEVPVNAEGGNGNAALVLRRRVGFGTGDFLELAQGTAAGAGGVDVLAVGEGVGKALIGLAVAKRDRLLGIAIWHGMEIKRRLGARAHLLALGFVGGEVVRSGRKADREIVAVAGSHTQGPEGAEAALQRGIGLAIGTRVGIGLGAEYLFQQRSAAGTVGLLLLAQGHRAAVACKAAIVAHRADDAFAITAGGLSGCQPVALAAKALQIGNHGGKA